MYDASNRKDIRRAEKAAARSQRDRIEFISAAMSTAQGRAWFHQLFSDCHLFTVVFTGDPYQLAFSEGERNVGIQKYAEVVANCPNEYILMMQEAQQKEIANASRSLDRNPDEPDAGSPDSSDEPVDPASVEYPGSEDPGR